MIRLAVVLLPFFLGCGATATERERTPVPSAIEPSATPVVKSEMEPMARPAGEVEGGTITADNPHVPVKRSSETPLSEMEARAVLARWFREAGYRILYDQPLQEGVLRLFVDGFDPAARVGYEYLDPTEVGIEPLKRLNARADSKILVVGPSLSERALSARAKSFLAALPKSASR